MAQIYSNADIITVDPRWNALGVSGITPADIYNYLEHTIPKDQIKVYHSK
ncbi:hypothetical protein [Neisseria iguanae]|nr:hypothetical protein [Neisseria iguanae]